MTGLPAAARKDAPGAHLVLYDGVCGLCNAVLQFLFTHDPAGVFMFAALQSAAGASMVSRFGGNTEALTSFFVIADFQSPAARLLARSDAAIFVASRLGWPWRALRLAAVLPRGLRDGVYDAIARNRYRVFGRYEECVLPTPEQRRRFLE